jgi:hypothetical protein
MKIKEEEKQDHIPPAPKLINKNTIPLPYLTSVPNKETIDIKVTINCNLFIFASIIFSGMEARALDS